MRLRTSWLQILIVLVITLGASSVIFFPALKIYWCVKQDGKTFRYCVEKNEQESNHIPF